MNINTYVLLGSGRLKPYKKQLLRESKKCVLKIKKFLPLKDVDILIMDNPKSTITHLGVGGYTADKSTVYISLNPAHKKFEETIHTHLFRTLTHELHHVMRWKRVGYGETLFEALIAEGLADHFDIEMSGQDPQAWDRALSQKQIDYWLKKASSDFDNKEYNHKDWFFGSEKRNIPLWTGYSLGFYVVQRYLDSHPKKSAATLYNVEAKKFLKV